MILVVACALLLVVVVVIISRGRIITIKGERYFDGPGLETLQRLRADVKKIIKCNNLAERRFHGMIMGSIPPSSQDLGFVRVWTREFRVRTDLDYKKILHIAKHEAAHLMTWNWLSHGQDFKNTLKKM